MVLILMLSAILTKCRLNDGTVMKQGSRRESSMMNKPEEVFASWDRSTRPNAAREVISRLLFHVPQVEGTGGERAKVSTDATTIRNIR